MNTRTFSIGIALLALMGLSACNDFSSPSGVLGVAMEAVKDRDVKKLKKSLSEDLQANYGTSEGLENLRARFSGHGDPFVSRNQLIQADQGDQGWGRHGDILRIYETDISSKDQQGDAFLFATTVSCSVRARRIPGEQRCHRHCSPRGSCHETCHSGPPSYEEVQSCLISKL